MLISYLLLIAASFIAGIISSFAGGGSFLTFPALMLTGVDARTANITSTIAMYPMQVSTGFSGRDTAVDTKHLTFRELFIISFTGGVIGALLLVMTPEAHFARLVPWLVLFSTALFAWSNMRSDVQAANLIDVEKTDKLGRIGSAVSQFAISIYGGYFGAGIGLLMLAALTRAGMKIRPAISTKNILAAVMNTSAVGIFVLTTDVYWFRAGIVAVAATAGGLLGVKLIDRIDEKYLRYGTVVIGLALTATLFARSY